MCGLIGVFGNIIQQDLKFFKKALVCDWIRGPHSTGMAKLTDNGTFIRKAAVNPIDFLDFKSTESLLTVSARGFIGHNRHATVGSVNNVNAHPFRHGSITLAHNGTLTNKWKLERDYKAPSFTTDSELVCWLIANFDVDQVVEDLEGAFALTWYDTDDNSFNVVRNDEREFTMHIGKNRVHWCSESWMLKGLMDHCNITYSEEDVFEPKVGEHICIHYEKGAVVVNRQQLKVAAKKRVTKTGGGNVVPYKARPSTNAQFKKEFDIDVSVGATIYAWVNSSRPNTSGDNRVNVTATLAVHPYCDVHIYWTPDNEAFNTDNKDVNGLRLQVRAVNLRDGEWSIVADNTPSKIVPVKTAEQVTAMTEFHHSGQIIDAEYEDITDQEEDEEEKAKAMLFTGFQGRQLNYKDFKSVVSKGCACCDQVFDPVQEVVDRSAVFISHDEVVCSTCFNDPMYAMQFGWDNIQGLKH